MQWGASRLGHAYIERAGRNDEGRCREARDGPWRNGARLRSACARRRDNLRERTPGAGRRNAGSAAGCGRTGRRTRAGGRGERMHWAKTMQLAARQDGDVLRLPRMQRKPQNLPLLILVDISGSMERYARLLLAFLHQATRGTPRQVFAFGTGLTDLNPAFKLRDTDDMLALASHQIKDFAGGTQLGQSLTQFRSRHAKKLTGRRTVVLLISDGLDTGTAETLDSELVWLKRHTRSLLWLNPLLRFEGYAPLATGASVLNRHVKGMLAIHNLSRLEELASALSKLLKSH